MGLFVQPGNCGQTPGSGRMTDKPQLIGIHRQFLVCRQYAQNLVLPIST